MARAPLATAAPLGARRVANIGSIERRFKFVRSFDNQCTQQEQQRLGFYAT